MSTNRLYALLTTAALIAALLVTIGPGPEIQREPPPARRTQVAAAASIPSTLATTATITRQDPPPPAVDQVLPTEYRIADTVVTTTQPPRQATNSTIHPPRATTTTVPPATTTTQPAGGYRNDLAGQFVSRINGLRSSNGLAALTQSSDLNSEARAWAKTMAQAGSLSHSNLGRLIPPWSSVGENVGVGGSVDSIFGAFAASPGHKANMLGDFTHVGVGVWQDADGTLWTAHLFAS